MVIWKLFKQYLPLKKMMYELLYNFRFNSPHFYLVQFLCKYFHCKIFKSKWQGSKFVHQRFLCKRKNIQISYIVQGNHYTKGR